MQYKMEDIAKVINAFEVKHDQKNNLFIESGN